MSKVYIETSIVSYLTARPSGQLTTAARQKETHDWWETQKERFTLCISKMVIEEAEKGDKNAASKRLAKLSGIEIIPLNDKVVELSKALVAEG